MTMHPRVTAATIAAHTGLSRATVTHVLNGRAAALRIRPDTQRRVREAARELGYRPNTSARALMTGKFGSVALLQSLRAAYLPDRLLHGIAETLTEHNLYLSVAEAPDTVMDDESYLPKVLRELSADGLIINRIIRLSDHFIRAIYSLQTPAVFLNVKQEMDSVHPDDLMGGGIATEYLLRLGHRRILYVKAAVNEQEHYSAIDRRLGYEHVMAEAGLTPQFLSLPADPITHEQTLNDRRVPVAREFLATVKPVPTAAIAYELAEAMAVLHACHQLQIRIPDDLSLLMFHPGPEHRICIPVTTVSNAVHRVGQEAVRMLIEKIAHPGLSLPTRTVPMELVEGGTCSVFRTGGVSR